MIPVGVEKTNNILPPGRCACHERTVKWCGRHGQPLKLIPGEFCMMDHDLFFLKECLDPVKAEQLAERIRAVMKGHV